MDVDNVEGTSQTFVLYKGITFKCNLNRRKRRLLKTQSDQLSENFIAKLLLGKI